MQRPTEARLLLDDSLVVFANVIVRPRCFIATLKQYAVVYVAAILSPVDVEVASSKVNHRTHNSFP
jgi:hypothetical protein